MNKLIIIFCLQLVLFSAVKLIRDKKNKSLSTRGYEQWIENSVYIGLSSELLMASYHGKSLFDYPIAVIFISLISVLSVFLVFYGLFKYYWGNIISITLLFMIGSTNFIKLSTRKDPVYLADITIDNAINVVWDMYLVPYKSQSFLLISGAMLVIFLFVKLKKQLSNEKHCLIKERFVIFGVGLLCLISLSFQSEIVIKKANIQLYPFNYIQNLESNGTIVNFISSLDSKLMKEPDDYSREKMQQIEKKLIDALPEQKNKEENPNVIYILSEAFSDPSRFTKAKWKEDPIPVIRNKIKKNGGTFLSPEFGGNTANIEFNVLTSFSSNFLLNGKIPYEVLSIEKEKSGSIVNYYQSLGYHTVAMHPYESYFYKRDKVFKNMGFDEMIFQDTIAFKGTDSLGAYISDHSFIGSIKKQLEDESGPQFIHGITMQNHYPYTKEMKYSQNRLIKNEFNGQNELDLYANGMLATDKSMKELFSYLETIDRETYVVFYGDHMPVLDDNLYASGLRGVGNLEEKKYQTEYFVWSNKGNITNKGPISPNFINEMVLEQASLPLTPFYYFLSELRETVAALGKEYSLTKNGKLVKNFSKYTLEQLNDYYLLQYDMLMGKQYSKSLYSVSIQE